MDPIDKILRDIYYNTKKSSAFTSVKRLYLEAKKKISTLTIKDVKKWLSGELTYTLHKPVRKNFKRNKILVSTIDEQWEADLADMKEYKRNISGYTFILTVIDCFSKFAFVRPLKVKTGASVTNAFKDIFKKRKPLNLRTDKGKEFLNSNFQKYLKENKVNFFTSNDQKIKCAIVERFNRTLKSRMFKYFTANGTRKYINVLQDFVDSYNRSLHRTIKMRPIDVTPNKAKQVFKNIYNKETARDVILSQINKIPKLSSGDKVRKTYDLKAFDRGFYPNWTDEIFTVEKSIKGNNQYIFKIKDYLGGTVKQRFYSEELQKITENLYRIEKILKTRKIKGKKEYFVKWINFPPKYNTWVTDIKNIKNG